MYINLAKLNNREGINREVEVYPAIQGEGYTLGTPTIFVRLWGCNLHCTFCWGSGTKILMADLSYKNIEDIKVGELVMSYNNRKFTVSKVNFLYNRMVDEVVSLECDNTITEVTPEHRYYTNRRKGSKKNLLPAIQLETNYLKQAHFNLKESFDETNKDFRLGYFKGALLGDGNATFQNPYLRLYFQVCDYDFIERIADIANNDLGFNGNITLSSRKTKANREVYRYSVGKLAKKIDYLLDLPIGDNEIRGFVTGFFDAEGTSSRNQISFCQKDIKILERVKGWLEYFNFKPTLEIRDINRLTINNKKEVDRFFKEFPIAIKRKLLKNKEKNRVLTSKKVDKVTLIKKKTKVYNITTTVGNCFANGFLATQCDTAYTWYMEGNKNVHEFEKNKYSIEATRLRIDTKRLAETIIETIKQQAPGVNTVTFTGGEPLLQQQALLEVIKHLINISGTEDWFFEIETNGTFKIMDIKDYLNQITCSPKMENSGNAKELRYKPEVIKNYLDFANTDKDKHTIFKFVVGSVYDIEEIDAFVFMNNIPKTMVYLMPKGIYSNDVIESTKMLCDIGLKKGYRITTRLQVILHDN